MTSRFLQSLAQAHQKHEGWYPGSLSQRNNNPGNLRLTAYQRKVYGAVPGDRNFARFTSYEAGLQALMDDLRAKINGQSAHIDYRRNPTFLTYVRVYAPSDDGNNPNSYTQSLIHSMADAGYTLTPQTPLSDMAAIILSEESEPTFSIGAQLKRLARAIARSTGVVKDMLAKEYERLLKRQK